jgi:hypothetical protein
MNASGVRSDVPARDVLYQYGYHIPNGVIVHHKNGNHFDNRIENLTLYDPQRHIEYHALSDPEARESYAKQYEQPPQKYNLDMSSDVYDKFFDTKFAPKPVETLNTYDVNPTTVAKNCGLSPKDKLYPLLANDSRNVAQKIKEDKKPSDNDKIRKAWKEYKSQKNR